MKPMIKNIKQLTAAPLHILIAVTLFVSSLYTSPISAQELDEILEQHNVEVMKEVATIQAQMDRLYDKDELSDEETEQLFQLENLLDEFYETLM